MMSDANPSPNVQKQMMLQKRHAEMLKQLATRAHVRELEAKQKAEAAEAKREAVLWKSGEVR
jgi:hypothetical protein